jgi:phenylacetate-CoA ligase
MDEIIATLELEQPDVILGYAGVLGRLAESLNEGQTAINPRIVISASEVLTSVTRHRLGRVFNASVRDVYASWELGLMAYECGAGGAYHTCDDNLILEVEKDGKPVGEGETGNVLGTNLHFAAMPFIRYEIGDLATRGPDRCPCGAPFHTLSSIDGRVQDYFRLPDGRVIHPMHITAMVRETVFRSIRQYQVVQERIDRVVARVVARSEEGKPDVENVFREVEAFLGPGVSVAVEFTDEIPPGPGGKIGEYRSLVGAA